MAEAPPKRRPRKMVRPSPTDPGARPSTADQLSHFWTDTRTAVVVQSSSPAPNFDLGPAHPHILGGRCGRVALPQKFPPGYGCAGWVADLAGPPQVGSGPAPGQAPAGPAPILGGAKLFALPRPVLLCVEHTKVVVRRRSRAPDPGPAHPARPTPTTRRLLGPNMFLCVQRRCACRSSCARTTSWSC